MKRSPTPSHSPRADAPGQPRQPTAYAAPNASDQARFKVLVADDSLLLRDALCDLLGRMDDLEVVAQAATGAEAVSLVAKVNPDVVVLDFRMPEMNGLDAARFILARHPDVGIVLYTSEDGEAVRHHAKNAGVHGFVRKGDGLKQLIDAIRLVAGSRGTEPTTLRVGRQGQDGS